MRRRLPSELFHKRIHCIYKNICFVFVCAEHTGAEDGLDMKLPVYANTSEMALKLKTSAERKASKQRKHKKVKAKDDPLKVRPGSAHVLDWSNALFDSSVQLPSNLLKFHSMILNVLETNCL